MTTGTPTASGLLLTRDEILARAEQLSALYRESAAQGEQERRVTERSWAAFEESGLIGLITPPELGGIGAELQTFIDVTRILARGDASAAWISSYIMQNSWYSARMAQPLRGELFSAHPYALVAGSGAARPTNIVQHVAGGYLLTGRWSYTSGCMQAEWLTLGGMVDTGDGREMMRFLVPVTDATIHYDWAMSGMRGTGSHDVSLDGVFVPAHRGVTETFAALGATRLAASEFEYPLMRYPALQVILLMHTALVVGTAQAAVEMFPAAVDRRFNPFSGVQPKDSAVVHSVFGRSSFQAASASAVLDDAVRVLDRIGQAPDEATFEDRARLNLTAVGAIQLGVEAVRTVIGEAGTKPHKDGDPLGRLLHDAEVIASHPTSDWSFWTETAGRVLLGKGIAPADPAFF